MKGTKDKLFLLSVEEYEKYRDRIPGASHWWWLRSPGCYSGAVALVYDDGDVGLRGSFVNCTLGGVRPACYLNPESEILKSESGAFPMGEYDGKPVEWIILDREAGLCISKDILCKHRFGYRNNNYETSKIKDFLKDMEQEIFEEREAEHER